ncbi:MAG: hypothetical protein WC601_09235 [Desulfotomaculaceae bacterium]
MALEQSLKIDPVQMESLYSLGKILHEAGEDEAAVRYLRQALINAHLREICHLEGWYLWYPVGLLAKERLVMWILLLTWMK